MEVAAALDLGSNTLRLLVARVDQNGYQALFRGLCTPRLGRGLTTGGELAPEAKESAGQNAVRFVEQARKQGARRIFLAATQACRIAADGERFVAFLGRELGLDSARVLSGPDEARLSRLGVLSRLEGPAKGALLADVGGGSTELAPLDGDQGISLPVGAVSLSEAHIASDPPAPAELQALIAAVVEGLARASEMNRATRLVATAGTAATLASLRQGLTTYQPERLDNCRVGRAELFAEFKRLAAMDLARRKQTPGLEPERADIILGGLAILNGLLEILNLQELTTMDAGLLEGILLDGLAA